MKFHDFLRRFGLPAKVAGKMPSPHGPGILPRPCILKRTAFSSQTPLRLWRLLPLLALLAGCSWFGKQSNSSQEKPTLEGPQLVGRIASIPADKRFVLIQSYDTWKIESGTILTTRGLDERSANLRVTGESMGQFAAADIQSGTAEIGDAVYSSHVPKPSESAPKTTAKPELPENQSPNETENVENNN